MEDLKDRSESLCPVEATFPQSWQNQFSMEEEDMPRWVKQKPTFPTTQRHALTADGKHGPAIEMAGLHTAKTKWKVGVGAQTYNPSTQEAEASPQGPDQQGFHKKFKTS